MQCTRILRLALHNVKLSVYSNEVKERAGKAVRLDKGARLELWDRLNRHPFSAFRTEIEGAWRFSASSKHDILQPHLWIVGAVHGNEAVGAVVLEQLMKKAIQGDLLEAGEVTFVIGNPAALIEDVRYIDRDLNRAFALRDEESQSTAVEVIRQREIHQLLAERPPHFVLDLHSVSRGDHGIIVYPKASLPWAESLGCVGTHFCYSCDHMAGETLIDAAHHYGAAAMVIECGHHHSPNTAIVALAQIERLLRHFDMSQKSLIDCPLAEFSTITRYRSKDMIKPHTGFRFLFPVETGTQVEAGCVFAIDDEGEHKAADTAWLMMPSLVINEDDEDAGWMCSRELIPCAEIEHDHLTLSLSSLTVSERSI